MGFATSKIFHDLVRSFEVEVAAEPLCPPSRDLELVLRAMRSEAYEPITNLSPRAFTKNSVFIVAVYCQERS